MNNLLGQSPFHGMLPPLRREHVQSSLSQPRQVLNPEEPVLMLQEEQEPSAPPQQRRVTRPEEEPPIVDDQFTYEGYQVVRGEYFSHLNEPSVSFSDNTFSVNTACLRKAPDTSYVQVLVNQTDRKLVVRPCTEDVKDSFSWHTASRKPKKVICPLFFGKIMSLMGWNPEHRYKIIGKQIVSQGQHLFVFDLNSPEIYKRSMQIDANGNEKRRSAKKPVYLDSWKDQFGLPVAEHQQSLQINVFDDFFLVGVKETKKVPGYQNSEEGNQDESKSRTEYSSGLPASANQD